MRYNDFTHDHISKCDCEPPYSAENAIAARNDLNPINSTYPFTAHGHRSHAGTDAKFTAKTIFHDLEYFAVNGPTTDDRPVFKWSESDYNDMVSHFGHPDVWDFPVVLQTWKWSTNETLNTFGDNEV